MGRLPPLVATLGLALVGCDKGSDATTTLRSDQVIATGSMPTAAPPVASEAHAAPSEQARARSLCQGDGNAKGRVVPKAAASHVEATGAPALDATLSPSGTWTWVNFWAAWCGPCKEEIPRLLRWRDRLAHDGAPLRLVFVSMDDDERQLSQFLEAQPADGVRSSLWLPDGPTRGLWLRSLRMDGSAELPQQALVDPTGKVRCFIEGAVDDGDFAEVAALVGRPVQP